MIYHSLVWVLGSVLFFVVISCGQDNFALSQKAVLDFSASALEVPGSGGSGEAQDPACKSDDDDKDDAEDDDKCDLNDDKNDDQVDDDDKMDDAKY